MSKVIEPQMQLGEEAIGAIRLDPKSRDDIPQLLQGLQHLYITPEVRERVFAILEEVQGQGVALDRRLAAAREVVVVADVSSEISDELVDEKVVEVDDKLPEVDEEEVAEVGEEDVALLVEVAAQDALAVLVRVAVVLEEDDSVARGGCAVESGASRVLNLPELYLDRAEQRLCPAENPSEN